MAIAGIGRPSSYTESIDKEICDRLSGGQSLLSICELDHMPAQPTVFQWIVRNEQFAKNYARARQSWAVAEFEKMMRLMDEPCYLPRTTTKQVDGKVVSVETVMVDAVEHRRLQIDTRKWALARMFPKVYGEAMQLRHADANGDQLTFRVEDARQRVAPARVLEIPPADQDQD
jgi:hypothetical protein